MYTTADSEATAETTAQLQESASEDHRAFSVITSATAAPDASVTEIVDSNDSDVVAAVEPAAEPAAKPSDLVQEEIVEDTSVDGRESTQEMYDSDSLQQTYDLQETTSDLQEAEQKNESYPQPAYDEQNQTVDQNQTTSEFGQSDSNQSLGYSYQETPAAVAESHNESVQEEAMDVTESVSAVPEKEVSAEEVQQPPAQYDPSEAYQDDQNEVSQNDVGGVGAAGEEKEADKSQTEVSNAKFSVFGWKIDWGACGGSGTARITAKLLL